MQGLPKDVKVGTFETWSQFGQRKSKHAVQVDSTTKTRDVSSFQHPAFTPTCFVALASWGVGCMHV